jgi:hypothetical protein
MKKSTLNSQSKKLKKKEQPNKKLKLTTKKVKDLPANQTHKTKEVVLRGIDAVKLSSAEPVKKIKPRDKEHYVNGKEFEEEIRNYYNTGAITVKLGESINKIASGLSYATNFINYSYKEDMIGDAIVKMFSALKNKSFKLDSGFSPFSYFTTIAFHAFINRIKKEKKHHEALNDYRDKVYTELMIDTNDVNGTHVYVDPAYSNDDDY